ncbi:adaptor protein NBP2 KNAG_0A05020 [Huiozyma naganishii CBS 8797]|uniref:SH3 domain-containing protein n=1 Tax=Huiozyma naganishii (strain ATCC MYA-139 / BCRC 22969 / CBS 8797 / KCTC 17520 / NBRC 10181 / NCYC 3082 / Yp74L-3) TaxID=1071383 RepID=J7R045_HUIN7|nr:hypothetical protein KNAG_0A05020 [Kazachstania naganishii CBS 8797]CCK68170.1 hypothetical protein KNAG_0A05020 [Kazachstania naganishii CBS 8797]
MSELETITKRTVPGGDVAKNSDGDLPVAENDKVQLSQEKSSIRVNLKSGKEDHNNSNVQPGDKSDDETSTVGYISIKDFAYSEADPLHYGYFDEEDNESGMINSDGVSTGANNDGELEDAETKRQSVILPRDYIVNHRAIALYDFEPENDNELELKEEDVVYISYKHGQGWLVAENEQRTKTGLVPEEFVSYIESDEAERTQDEDVVRPFYLTQLISQSLTPGQGTNNTKQSNGKHGSGRETKTKKGDEDDGEWEDVDELETDLHNKLNL